MNKFLKQLGKAKGFTLIELLVVIGILGVLAAALIATIDPFEQIKKAQDSNTKNTTVEFVNASIRYYSTHNYLPWDSASGTGTCAGATAATLSTNNTCITALINDGELKDSFTSSNIIQNINYIGNNAGVTACFRPKSKSQWRDPNTIYNSAGVATTGCTAATSESSSCYWCSK